MFELGFAKGLIVASRRARCAGRRRHLPPTGYYEAVCRSYLITGNVRNRTTLRRKLADTQPFLPSSYCT